MPQDKTSSASAPTSSTSTGLPATTTSTAAAFKLTTSKSNLAPKHQYKRTASGTAIRGPAVASSVITMDMDPTTFHLDSGPTRGQVTSTTTTTSTSGSALPPAIRVRLYELFVQIEREFEVLYSENLSLQERVDWLNNEQQQQHVQQLTQQQHHQLQQQHHHQQSNNFQHRRSGADHLDGQASPAVTSSTGQSLMTTMTASFPKRGIYAHKLRSHTNKLRQQTNRIMSNLKGPPTINCVPLRRYTGHKDGIWEVSVSRIGLPIIGTASADHTSIVWGMHSGRPLLQYTGHAGSVNSIRFHPNKELVLTASGDGTAHIWQCAVHIYNESSSGRMASSEDELADNPGSDSNYCQPDSLTLDDHEEDCSVLRTPLRALAGHVGVVIAADWLPGGDQAVTAGWDRLACIWDTQTGQLLHQLTGHDEELTHTSAHPTSRLVVTSSKDSTFRLWDFRDAIHSVSVFQGHQDTVTSAIFTREDQVISGSDDRTVRIWDLRNMRSPLANIHADSAANRLSVSSTGLIAIPFDNRNVRLYDINGQRVGRLPRSSRQGHARMVCSTAWSEDTKPNLFTCGFDRVTLGWSVQPREHVKDNDAASETRSIMLTQQPSSTLSLTSTTTLLTSPQPSIGSMSISSGGDGSAKQMRGSNNNKDILGSTGSSASKENQASNNAKEPGVK